MNSEHVIERMDEIPLGAAVTAILFAPLALVVWVVLLAPVVVWVGMGGILCMVTQRDWLAPVRGLPRMQQ